MLCPVYGGKNEHCVGWATLWRKKSMICVNSGFRRRVNEVFVLICELVGSCRRFGTTYPSSKFNQSISSLTAWPLKMEPIDCLETLATNHKSKLCNVPEEQVPHSMICFISEDEGKGRGILWGSAASSAKIPCVIVATLIRKNVRCFGNVAGHWRHEGCCDLIQGGVFYKDMEWYQGSLFIAKSYVFLWLDHLENFQPLIPTSNWKTPTQIFMCFINHYVAYYHVLCVFCSPNPIYIYTHTVFARVISASAYFAHPNF